mmetsp:Transcript_4936/g.12476  ORF Transcript_4936/g.12476 Transcript_4936/m.12476 type:complete len:999 (-) Transcript_4936:141-3137(-)
MTEIDGIPFPETDLGGTRLRLEDGSQLLVPDVIVEEGPGRVRHPLLDDHVYSKLQRNKFFEAQPSVVYFGGFQLDSTHEQVVHVVNVSSETKRMHILQCETPFFRVHVRKKGRVAPGMSEELVVQFTPNEWRYYYDAIRIHSDDDNIVIPLHAYPTVLPIPSHAPVPRNTILGRDQAAFFPAKVDMGWCQLSRTASKTVPITCTVPVDFEFSIRVLEPHPDMEVFPLQGLVPGEGEAVIEFLYCPSRMATAEMVIEVSISQFGFKPQICSVVGSAEPGAIRNGTIKAITADLRKTGVVDKKFNLANYTKVPAVGEVKADLTVVHDESKGFKDKIDTLRASRKPGVPIEIRYPEPWHPEPETHVDGYMLPADLKPRAATQYVLNQVHGKLSYQELKRQMEESGQMPQGDESGLDPKAKANQSITWFENLRMQPGGFLDIEEDYGEGQTRQICEFKYGYELRMRDEYDKAKTVKWFPAIGDKPTAPEEHEAVRLRRAERESEFAARWRESQRGVRANVCDPKKQVVHRQGGLPAHVPTFDEYLNDAWSTRKEITERFRQEVHKLIIRQRVSRRLAAINAKLELVSGGGANSQIVDAILSAESAPTASGRRRDEHQLSRMQDGRVVTHTFPLYREGNFRDRKLVSPGEIETFEDWDYVDLKVPQTFKLMGYKPVELPPVGCYVSLESLRNMREGAEEEAGIRYPRGPPDPVPSSEILKIPDCFTVRPNEVPPLCRTYDPTNRPIEGRARSIVYKGFSLHENHPEWPLRPYERRVGDSALKLEHTLPAASRGARLEDALFGQVKDATVVPEPEAPGFGGMRTLRGVPLLSGKWLSRRELPGVLVAGLPRMMTGPDIADAQSEDEDDRDDGEEERLPLVIAVPTPDFVKENFKLPSFGPPAAEEGEESTPQPAAEGSTEGESRPQTAGGEVQKIPVNARAMHSKELEEEFVAKRRALEDRLPAAIRGLNETIHDPRKRLALEPSEFPVPELQWLTELKPSREG